MRVELYCDSGANIHSRRSEIVDTVDEFNILDEEWRAMSDEKKEELVREWRDDRLEWGWEDLD